MNVNVYVESHDGWTAKQDMSGGYAILDQNGWALATIHYDYRFTCNATNYHRAAMLSAAPDMLTALTAVNKLVSEAAMTGFNCHDGNWAERLFQSQQATSRAIKKASSLPPANPTEDMGGPR